MNRSSSWDTQWTGDEIKVMKNANAPKIKFNKIPTRKASAKGIRQKISYLFDGIPLEASGIRIIYQPK